MLLQTWGDVLNASFQNLWFGVVAFVPNLVIAIILFIAGWFLGRALGRGVAQLFSTLKFDSLFKGTAFDEALQKSGMKVSVSGFFGGIVKWFFIVLFLMASLDIVGLTQVNVFLRDVVVNFLPNVVIAAFVLLIATFVSNAMKKIVVGSAKAAGVSSANMLGTVTVYAIWIFAFIIALSELGIAVQFMQILFTGIIAMLAIAGGLAFGLGGRDAASRTIERVRDEMGGRR
ncbi:hypothetical protein H6790_00210 [Candidatus Nomurabacteria bacterium]|nr:hypothetical protein [Candidatus Nomurabacteria bacterium]MCB9820358.1 hypothetical protein [Candidatus Nomurabacteria bacterium]